MKNRFKFEKEEDRLIPEFKKMINEGEITLLKGLYLAKLSKEEQQKILIAMKNEN